MVLRKHARRSLTVVALFLVILLPALVLAVTLAFLQFAQAVAIGELSALELVELYLIEMVVFGVAAYLLYRLAIATLEEELPEWIEPVEDEGDADEE
jgi:uncharacterized BrkB/YihY/UPF0761 family membrane protein